MNIFRIYQFDNKWYWQLARNNGHVVAYSEHGYSTKAICRAAIAKIVFSLRCSTYKITEIKHAKTN